MSPRLVVLTVNYCCADAILEGMDETVRQIRAQGDAAFWIVDNMSPDDSLATLRDAVAARGFEDVVTIIASPKNAGFGAGNNVGFDAGLNSETPPEYFYCLNPDAVPDDGAIATFVDFMDAHPDAGMAGGRINNEFGVPEASVFRFPSFASEVEKAISLGVLRKLLRNSVVPMEMPDTIQKVDWVSGASFIIRASVLKQTGGFDETFFLYWEEVELCHRITKAGFGVYAVPEAGVVHTGGVSTGMGDAEKRIPRYWFESRNYLLSKTGLTKSLVLLNACVALGWVVQRTHHKLRGKSLHSPHFLKDFIRFFTAKPTAR